MTKEEWVRVLRAAGVELAERADVVMEDGEERGVEYSGYLLANARMLTVLARAIENLDGKVPKKNTT